MNTTIKNIAHLCRNVIYSVSIFPIIICMLILWITMANLGKPVVLLSQKPATIESKLIDVDENLWRFCNSNLYYTADGRIVADLAEGNSVEDYNVYLPDSSSFVPFDKKRSNSLICKVKELRVSNCFAHYSQGEGPLKSVLIIPSDSYDALEIWRYDDVKKYYTCYKDKKIYGYLSESGFTENNDNLKDISESSPYIWVKKFNVEGQQKYRTFMLYPGTEGFYFIDFLERKFEKVISFENDIKLMDWNITDWRGE